MTETLSTRDRILAAARTLVLERGFGATSVDAVLEASGTSKGAFFHHFHSKSALGRALVQDYARADAEMLDSLVAAAESRSSDPVEQLFDLVRSLEEAIDELGSQPGCLFVSFIYEQIPDGGEIEDLVIGSIALWRDRLHEKLAAAVAVRPPALPVDLPSLADQFFTIFEGGFILARATGDRSRLRAQLEHLRNYLALLLRVGGEDMPA